MISFDIDKAQTSKNARELLKKYRRLTLISKSAYSLRSSRLSQSTVNYSNQNDREEQIQKFISRKNDAEAAIKAIDEALSRLDDDDQNLLKKKFCNRQLPDYVIYNSLGMSESNFYRILREALVHFAECFGDGLVVWK